MSSNNDDLASKIGRHRLQQLEQASESFPVPAIRKAAKAALGTLILVMSITGRQRATLITIGKEACVITANVVGRVDPDGNGNVARFRHTSNLEQDSTTLVQEMEAIQKDIQNHINSGGFSRIFSRAMDAIVIKTCRARLTNAVKLFELKSNMELRQEFSLLDQNLQALLDKCDRLQAPPLQTPPSPNPPMYTPNPAMYMPNPAPHSSNLLRVPSPALRSCIPIPSSPTPTWLQPSILPHDWSLSFPQPSPVSSSWTPNDETTQELSRMERRTARRARREARATQQVQHPANVTGTSSPPSTPASYNTFTNLQTHLLPGNNVSYHYVNGSVTNYSRDDSFNVSGSGNKINLTFS